MISLLESFHVGGAVLSMGFVPLVAVAFIALGRRSGLLFSILCTAIMGIDHLYHWLVAENITLAMSVERLLALGSIWLMALLLIWRERMHVALEDSRAQNEAILMTATDGILTADAEGRIVSANPAAEEMFGYPSGGLSGLALEELMPAAQRAEHHAALTEMLDGRRDGAAVVGTTRTFEGQHRDGSTFPVEVTVSVFHAGGRQLFSAVMRDVSERREAEQRLRESQRTLSTLLSNLPGMAYRCLPDENWTMLFVSQGCLALTGYEPHDLMQNRTTTYARLIYPDDRQRVAETVMQCVRDDTSYQLEYRIVRANGDIRWVWEQGRAVRGGSGSIRCLEGLVIDITPQKRIEEALRESEARFRNIADSTPIMIWASGLDMGITFANLG
ncbi:MAG TPA: PAS domain S-box protein [bacterium]|nr:PAS domain S-box protein [bacterium]